MKLYKTSDPQEKPPVVMLVYGDGGVGKTTFVSTAPKVLLADCENGAKYFGLRNIDINVAQIQKWPDMKEYLDEVSKSDFETVAIDPIGELMEKLKRHMLSLQDAKLVQKDGSPTMAGWGWMKTNLRNYIKALRDLNKHVIIIAHVQEENDEGRVIKRPKVETKLSEELVNLVDIVAYMTVVKMGDETKRVLFVDPDSDKFIAKDRTGQLGKIVEPNFSKIVEACQGTKKFSWSNSTAKVVTETEKGVTTVDPVVPINEPKEQDALDAELRKIHGRIGTGSDYSPETLLKEIMELGVEIVLLPPTVEKAKELYTKVGLAIVDTK